MDEDDGKSDFLKEIEAKKMLRTATDKPEAHADEVRFTQLPLRFVHIAILINAPHSRIV